MPKNILNNLISTIDSSYREINNKVKFFFLISFINKEFLKIMIKMFQLLRNISPYKRSNIMELSEITLISYEISVVERDEFIIKKKSELINMIIDIANSKLQGKVDAKINFLDVMLVNYISCYGLDIYAFRDEPTMTKKVLRITYK